MGRALSVHVMLTSVGAAAPRPERGEYRAAAAVLDRAHRSFSLAMVAQPSPFDGSLSTISVRTFPVRSATASYLRPPRSKATPWSRLSTPRFMSTRLARQTRRKRKNTGWFTASRRCTFIRPVSRGVWCSFVLGAHGSTAYSRDNIAGFVALVKRVSLYIAATYGLLTAHADV